MNFGQVPIFYDLAPVTGFTMDPIIMPETAPAALPVATDGPLRIFGLTNEERIVNIALTVGIVGTAWLLLRPR